MGKVTKVVIDTNLFISGFGWGGKPKEVLRLLENGVVRNFITPEIFEEIKRVVSYQKLKFPPSLQSKIIEFVFSFSRFVNPGKPVALIEEDPDDNKFIECALSANADYVVSGDPHLLNVVKFKDVRIVNAAQFLEFRPGSF